MKEESYFQWLVRMTRTVPPLLRYPFFALVTGTIVVGVGSVYLAGSVGNWTFAITMPALLFNITYNGYRCDKRERLDED